MAEPLTVAVAGAGLMGRWHAFYANRCGAKVTGFLDCDPGRAGRLAARYGARAFSELPVMLRELRPAVLHICTPSTTHVEMARAAVDAGVNALVEKPLGVSAADCEDLLDRALYRRVQLCPVHQFIFQNGVRLASAWLTSLGCRVHLQAVISSAGGALAPGARLDELADEILVHPLSLMASLVPEDLPVGNWSALRPIAGELRAFGERNGVSSTVLISMNGRPTECSFRIMGSKGSVYLDLFHGFAVREPADVSRSRKIVHPFDTATRTLWAAGLNLGVRAIRWEPAYPGLRRLIARFYAAVAGHEPPPFTRQEVVAAARARDEIMLAARMKADTASSSDVKLAR